MPRPPRFIPMRMLNGDSAAVFSVLVTMCLFTLVVAACGKGKPSGADYLGKWEGTVEALAGSERRCNLDISSIGESYVIKSERQAVGNCAAYEGIWTLTPEGNLKGGPMGSMLISYDRAKQQAVVSGLGRLKYLTRALPEKEVRAAAEAKGWWKDESELTWTVKDNGHGKVDWNAAVAYCTTLRVGSFSDWRLPSIEELESIHDPSRHDESINYLDRPAAIHSPLTLSKGGGWVWSATTVAAFDRAKGHEVRAARIFHFIQGNRDVIEIDNAIYSDARILCVRR